MAYDLKYGRVTLERATIGEDEPVVVFRARDALLPELLSHYRELCEAAGSPAHHLALLERSQAAVQAWQARHPTQVPRSDSLAPPDLGSPTSSPRRAYDPATREQGPAS